MSGEKKIQDDLMQQIDFVKRVVMDIPDQVNSQTRVPITAMELIRSPGVGLLLDNLDAWLWQTDIRHRYSFISANFVDITGIDPAYFVSRDRRDLIARSSPAPINRDDHFKSLDEKQPFARFEYKVSLPTKREIWVREMGLPAKEANKRYFGYVGAGFDITNEKNKLFEAERSTANLARAMDFIDVSVLIIDQNEKIYFSNERWKKLHKAMRPNEYTVGTLYEDYVRTAIKRGLFPEAIGDEEKYIRWRIENNRTPPAEPFSVKRQDGIEISIFVSKMGGMTAIISNQTSGPRIP